MFRITAFSIRTGLAGDERIISYRKLRLAGEPTPYLYLTAGIPVEAVTSGANRAILRNVALLMTRPGAGLCPGGAHRTAV